MLKNKVLLIVSSTFIISFLSFYINLITNNIYFHDFFLKKDFQFNIEVNEISLFFSFIFHFFFAIIFIIPFHFLNYENENNFIKINFKNKLNILCLFFSMIYLFIFTLNLFDNFFFKLLKNLEPCIYIFLFYSFLSINSKFKYIIVVLIFLNCIFGSVYLLSIFIFFSIVYLFLINFIIKKKIFLFLIMLLTFITLYNTRDYIRHSDIFYSDSKLNVFKTLKFKSQSISDIKSDVNYLFTNSYLTRRFDFISETANYLSQIKRYDFLDYLYGTTYFDTFLSKPRSLGHEIPYKYGLKGEDITHSRNLNYISECYLNFGFGGLIISFLLSMIFLLSLNLFKKSFLPIGLMFLGYFMINLSSNLILVLYYYPINLLILCLYLRLKNVYRIF